MKIMDNLFDYLHKNVVITDENGKVWNGYVDMYMDAYDNGDTEESICLYLDEKPDVITEFMSHEIKEIRSKEMTVNLYDRVLLKNGNKRQL